MYNSILLQKCKVNVSIFFQKFNILFVSKFQFRSDISLDRIGLLIDRVGVTILPLIMHFTTAIRFFPSWNGLKFSVILVLKFALFCLVYTQKQCRLCCMYLNLFRFYI